MAYCVNKIDNPRVLHCICGVLHQGLHVPLAFQQLQGKRKRFEVGRKKIMITNRFQILQRDITILVWTQQFKLLSYIKQLICSQCLG